MLLSIALLLLVIVLIIPLLAQHIRCKRRIARVFGIGYPRTGTSSLTQALRNLGYTTYHAPFASSFKNLHNWAGQYEALTDLHTHVTDFVRPPPAVPIDVAYDNPTYQVAGSVVDSVVDSVAAADDNVEMAGLHMYDNTMECDSVGYIARDDIYGTTPPGHGDETAATPSPMV
jgi:hypothetical protein